MVLQLPRTAPPLFGHDGVFRPSETEPRTYTVTDIDDFPAVEFTRRLGEYMDWEKWYDGRNLDEVLKEEGEEIELYPAKINPIPGVCTKHAFTLFGEVLDDDSPLVTPKFVTKTEAETEALADAEDMLKHVWWESQGRVTQFSNGLISQIYGGCIFKLAYIPWDIFRTVPIRIETVHPKAFIGFLEAGEQFRLSEAWIIKEIDANSANMYGVNVEKNRTAMWVEHWTKERHKIEINGQPIDYRIGSMRYTGNQPNIFGFVPIIYIPHVRKTGLWGESLIEPLTGLVKEINNRTADYGDAVSDDSHIMTAMRDAPKWVVEEIMGRKVVNLGLTNSLMGDGATPDLWEVGGNSSKSAMRELTDDLYEHFRRASFVPSVADGEDEGSQRSGLTLAFRMWPLTSHVKAERHYWTAGLNTLTQMILRMLFAVKQGNVTEDHLRRRIRQEWAPMLPRDREQEVNEAMIRIQNHLVSPQTGLQMLADIPDIGAEFDRIKEWVKYLAENSQSAADQGGFGNQVAKPKAPA